MPKLLFIFFAILSCIANSYAQGITVSPTRIFFTGAPGSNVTQTVTITNGGKAPFSFKATFSDWRRDSIGEKVYADAGTLPRSNADWLKLSETNLTVQPGESKQVNVTLTIPADASDVVTNSMLMLTQIAQQSDEYLKNNNIGIKVLFEFGLHVYYTPEKNTKEDLDFTAINFRGKVKIADKMYNRVAVQIKNVGNTVSDSSVDFELTNKATGEETKLDPIAISMMPDAEQIVYFDIPESLTGAYAGVAILRVGSAANVRVGEKDLSL